MRCGAQQQIKAARLDMIPSCNISDIYYMVTTHKWMGAERHKVYIEAMQDSFSFVFVVMAAHND